MSTLQQLVAKRKILKTRLTKFIKYIKKIDDDSSLTQLKFKLSKFMPTWQEFETIQSDIDLLDSSDQQEQERDKFETDYDEIIAITQDLIQKKESANDTEISIAQSNTQNAAFQVNLPSMELPTFSGQHEHWRSFHDLFKSLIDGNPSLDNIQKFQYLKTCLKSDAARVIESLNITADNYDLAWQLLKERFANTRLIIQRHIDLIYDIPNVAKNSASSLRELLDVVLSNMRALENLNMPVNHWDGLLIRIITSKLDFATINEWESNLGQTFPTFHELITFLTKRCDKLSSLERNRISKGSSQVIHSQSDNKTSGTKSNKHSSYTNIVAKNLSCKMCQSPHNLFQCNEFKSLSPKERIEIVKKHKLCLNCLKENHTVSQCYASNCKHCNKKHNSLLHLGNLSNNAESAVDPQPSTSSATVANITNIKSQVILSTAVVITYDKHGNEETCRALLDAGSQVHIITDALANKLGHKILPLNISVSGIGQSNTNISKVTNLTIKSKHNAFKANLQCLIIPKITENVPSFSFNLDDIILPKNIKLADPEFNKSRKIDMLIGSEIFWNLFCAGQIKLANNQPYWQKTHLGWVVGGKIYNHTPLNASFVMQCNTAQNKINFNLEKFWQIEEGQIDNKKILTSEELQCEDHFIKNHTRDETGRFCVNLPFNDKLALLGSSLKQAQSRLFSLERKLNKHPSLRAEYNQFLDEYVALGHMEELKIVNSESDNSNSCYYLPHHAVIKESSSTTKLRVVFDGSAKSDSGVSLNDTLMVGPNIQQDIISLIIRFRTYKYVLKADIAKMYRQIRINKQDTDFLRILWRDNPQDPIKKYKLNTVTYGTASAPFLAVRCLQQLAKDEQDNFPVVHDIILRDFYVDDLLTGSNNLSDLIQIRDDLIAALKKGGFELRKWDSNAPELISNLFTNQDNSHINLDFDANAKTLGLLWNNKLDTFKYLISSPNKQKKITKRHILSCTAQIFDPLGLIGPVIIEAKLMLQKIWSLKIGWDESVPLHIHTAWHDFALQLPTLNNLNIPRNVISHTHPKSIEIHGFCDASERAYGACIYIRSLSNNGSFNVQLLYAKSKVAPLKNISVPRLELCGALLLARLMRDTIKALNLKLSKLHYWTDSTIVLSWLAAPSNKWQTFVANRVSEIQKLSVIQNWNHIRTKSNPADLISRGISPEQLINSQLWWHGPDWLSQSKSKWPISDKIPQVDVPDKRKITLTIIDNEQIEILTRYSNYSKLQRVLAYCLRFVHNTKYSENKLINNLSCQELNKATTKILFLLQKTVFPLEIKELRKGRSIPSSSNLRSLNPFLDAEGLLRVGGRLNKVEIPYNKQHPVILPKNHHITKLIITREHIKQLHAGTQATLAALRENFWPLCGRQSVQHVLRQCVTCFRVKPTTLEQLMGDLPTSRLQPSRPFTHCGVDYAGPITIKASLSRSPKIIKSYIVLFICFATKAIHLELVTDLTSDGFIAVLKRFMGRRGKVSHLYSDNATNFIGANNQLKQLHNLLQSSSFKDKIVTELASENIEWHFIPARSPHFGGLWEAGVKSMKTHLRRVVGNALLNYEKLNSVLIQIESCLNSRPLTPLSSDPDDLQVLTPGHFLIGGPLTSTAEPDVLNIPKNRLSQWQHVQQISQHFWNRWSREYLTNLQERNKWHFKSSISLLPGMLVILKEDHTPPLRWPLGRIIELHPGSDDLIRTVSVKTCNGVVKRAITRLCLLPTEK